MYGTENNTASNSQYSEGNDEGTKPLSIGCCSVNPQEVFSNQSQGGGLCEPQLPRCSGLRTEYLFLQSPWTLGHTVTQSKKSSQQEVTPSRHLGSTDFTKVTRGRKGCLLHPFQIYFRITPWTFLSSQSPFSVMMQPRVPLPDPPSASSPDPCPLPSRISPQISKSNCIPPHCHAQ